MAVYDAAIHCYTSLQKSIKAKKEMANDRQDGRKRNNIQIGSEVEIVQKSDQRTGALTQGVVGRILTRSKTHPHGIKVQLETGETGRVKKVLP